MKKFFKVLHVLNLIAGAIAFIKGHTGAEIFFFTNAIVSYLYSKYEQ
jgi:hypothetical protein